jgi:O-antigen/teichoic acid export membrane protein
MAGALMLVMIPLKLNTIEQGYYYTFSSLIGMQIFFELGMNQVIVQMVSHNFAHIRVAGEKNSVIENQYLGRIVFLIRMLSKWYATAAILFFIVVGVIGAIFLQQKGNLPLHDWIYSWLILTLAAAANLYFSAKLTVYEGCEQVTEVAKMRLAQAFIGYGFLWCGLLMGGGLWAIPLLNVVAVFYTAYWLNTREESFINLKNVTISLNGDISWRKDIFPFQWRIAVSWISGYFIFQLFTPLVFAKFGAVEAGQIGITLAMYGALLIVGMSWINAKVPTMSAMVSRKDWKNLNTLFVTLTWQSMIFTLIGVIALIGMQIVLTNFGLKISERVASLPVVCCIAVVTLSNCFVSAAAAYMRAHLEEPMMWVSVASGLATLAAAVLGSQVSIFFMMLLCAGINVLIVLPWTIVLFRRYYYRNKTCAKLC